MSTTRVGKDYYRKQAILRFHKPGVLEIDDTASVSFGDQPYAWVQAWVKVDDPKAPERPEGIDGGRASLGEVLDCASAERASAFPVTFVVIEPTESADGFITGFGLTVYTSEPDRLRSRWLAETWGGFPVTIKKSILDTAGTRDEM